MKRLLWTLAAALLKLAGVFAFRLLMAFLGGLLLVAAARPCGYRAVVKKEVVVEKVIEAPVAVALYTPVAVAVPQVTVGYASPAPQPPLPQTAGPASAGPDAELVQIRNELAELRALLKQAPGAVVSPPASPPPAGAPRGLLTTCASCHGKTADADGKRHRFFDDSGALLPAAPVGRMMREVYAGRMPKEDRGKGTHPFTDAEVGTFIDQLGK